ncbi:MAG TPA: hypothetical protein VJT72_04875 [Pseudonocardiaceae bacterium]|nr:hypothetical protein [Pseudonocardiaceae bacterium]
MEFGTSRHQLRRIVFGPVLVTGALAALAVVAAVPPTLLGMGWLLPWLLLGLTAGYALSGSA